MKDKPMLFSGEMVRAILDGRKTQTRRIMKPQPYIDDVGNFCWNGSCFGQESGGKPCTRSLTSGIPHRKTGKPLCPYPVGTRIWVRETWNHSNYPFGPFCDTCDIFYREDYRNDPHGYDGEKALEGKYRKWLPSIHMPRAASRITLEVTDVRVERLQDISEADIIEEGCPNEVIYGTGWYRDLWESLNGPGSWEVNPWVWVIGFKVIKPALDVELAKAYRNIKDIRDSLEILREVEI